MRAAVSGRQEFSISISRGCSKGSSRALYGLERGCFGASPEP